MRILCCGSRDFRDQDLVRTVLRTWDPELVAHGGAEGADSLVGLCTVAAVYPADWKKHGKAAGPIRNAKMLADFKPDAVFAFINPGKMTPGTADMVKKARAAKVPVMIFEAKKGYSNDSPEAFPKSQVDDPAPAKNPTR